MPTINEMSTIKQRLDEACEAVASEVNNVGEGEGEGEGKLLVCYHNHYPKVAFSIYPMGGAESDNELVEYDSVTFHVSVLTDEDQAEAKITTILELLATREI